jgi:hypothetical protein
VINEVVAVAATFCFSRDKDDKCNCLPNYNTMLNQRLSEFNKPILTYPIGLQSDNNS